MHRLLYYSVFFLSGFFSVEFGRSNFIQAEEKKLPPAAKTPVDFARDIQPILKQHCAECHAGEIRKGGFSINSRESILDGSETDKVLIVGQSAKSSLIERIADPDPESRMPPKGKAALSAKQVSLLRGWIDQGLKWKPGFTFGALHKRAAMKPRRVILPNVPGLLNPIDRLLHAYFQKHSVPAKQLVSDRVFARRVWLDLIGLLPPAKELQAFVSDSRPDKHTRLVERLLHDRQAYAEHWMSFWSDLLRNDYRGTGYIDGGRKQITGWLFKSLYDNKPYDKFLDDLITGKNGAAGFLHGIKWRGTVNDSQRREMQAAQNIAQVFLGTNLKCASCHDSFVNHWKLKQAYAFASVFSSKPLELHRCNQPTGKTSQVSFLYPELGSIDANANLPSRLQQLSKLMTTHDNGRVPRTIVNRLWARFFGRGLVEPLDDMDQDPWHADLLDWLAYDLAVHNYDLKRTLRWICTSRAYRLPATDTAVAAKQVSVFRGPLVKRMTAEQFTDAVFLLADFWPKVTRSMQRRDGRGQGGQLTAIRNAFVKSNQKPISSPLPERIRCVFLDTDDLLKSLGRPIREQVVTRRESLATTLQCLELTNGQTLDSLLKVAAKNWRKRYGNSSDGLITAVFQAAYSRPATTAERKAAREILGAKPTQDDIQDFLWILVMQPEFQLIR